MRWDLIRTHDMDTIPVRLPFFTIFSDTGMAERHNIAAPQKN